ncbi:MAG: hypothetical protein QME76_06700 [Bacillota bacterium]|nr:hypothetical protein [Bacillota bacterium]
MKSRSAPASWRNAGQAEFLQRFNLRRVIFVADRGMVSPALLDKLDRQRIEYIVGVKMRRVGAVAEVLSTGGRYKVARDNLKVKEVWHDDCRYIVCYNLIRPSS